MVRELGLDNFTILRGRAEELKPQPADVVIAQALAKPTQALTYMLPWARPEATLVIPTSPSTPTDELVDDPRVVNQAIVAYAIPPDGRQGLLWWAQKA